MDPVSRAGEVNLSELKRMGREPAPDYLARGQGYQSPAGEAYEPESTPANPTPVTPATPTFPILVRLTADVIPCTSPDFVTPTTNAVQLVPDATGRCFAPGSTTFTVYVYGRKPLLKDTDVEIVQDPSGRWVPTAVPGEYSVLITSTTPDPASTATVKYLPALWLYWDGANRRRVYKGRVLTFDLNTPAAPALAAAHYHDAALVDHVAGFPLFALTCDPCKSATDTPVFFWCITVGNQSPQCLQGLYADFAGDGVVVRPVPYESLLACLEDCTDTEAYWCVTPAATPGVPIVPILPLTPCACTVVPAGFTVMAQGGTGCYLRANTTFNLVPNPTQPNGCNYFADVSTSTTGASANLVLYPQTGSGYLNIDVSDSQSNFDARFDLRLQTIGDCCAPITAIPNVSASHCIPVAAGTLPTVTIQPLCGSGSSGSSSGSSAPASRCMFGTRAAIVATGATIKGGPFQTPGECDKACQPATAKYYCVTYPGQPAQCLFGLFADLAPGSTNISQGFDTSTDCATACGCPPLCSACDKFAAVWNLNLSGFGGGAGIGTVGTVGLSPNACPACKDGTPLDVTILPASPFTADFADFNGKTQNGALTLPPFGNGCQFGSLISPPNNDPPPQVTVTFGVGTVTVIYVQDTPAGGAGPTATYTAAYSGLCCSPITVTSANIIPASLVVTPRCARVPPALTGSGLPVDDACSAFNLSTIQLRTNGDCQASYTNGIVRVVAQYLGSNNWKLTGTAPGCSFTAAGTGPCCGPANFTKIVATGSAPATLQLTAASGCDNCTDSPLPWWCVKYADGSTGCVQGTQAYAASLGTIQGTSFTDPTACGLFCNVPPPPPPPPTGTVTATDCEGCALCTANPWQWLLTLPAGWVDNAGPPAAPCSVLNSAKITLGHDSGDFNAGCIWAAGYSLAPPAPGGFAFKLTILGGGAMQLDISFGPTLLAVGTYTTAGVANCCARNVLTLASDALLCGAALPASVTVDPIGTCADKCAASMCCPNGLPAVLNASVAGWGTCNLTFDGVSAWNGSLVLLVGNVVVGTLNLAFACNGTPAFQLSMDCGAGAAFINTPANSVVAKSCGPPLKVVFGGPNSGNANGCPAGAWTTAITITAP